MNKYRLQAHAVLVFAMLMMRLGVGQQGTRS